MRTLFLLDRQDLADLRSGKPFDLRVGDTIITLQAETPTRRAPADPVPSQQPRRSHSDAFRQRVVKYATEHSVSAAVRKFHVVRSLVDKWRKAA